ncbi:PP2C family protein-serine/threonine phosphatase [Bryobacter aggregatus]|uniref:PP2C family protein-serine/threonine phosphatase n=1 Tax=Bryobacter aggregatus TaxID=360054 RepID=UPI0006910274|nr:protein phosphatase 2C domain-containing protein [Bryobacter aggregatus]
MMPTMQSYGLSDPGRVRKNNEDFLLVNRGQNLYIVADGMGGAQAGETASRLAAETVLEVMEKRGQSLRDLEEAFIEANDRVKRTAASDLTLEGMGTTLVGVLEDQNELHIASVGDSRVYSYYQGKLESLMEDQTWVNEVGRRLGIDEDTLKRHPMRHVLTMAIGVGNPLRVNTKTVPKLPGMQLLLCSDGLHGVVGADAIIAVLADPDKDLPSKAQTLVDAARNAGGPDNITVLILQV